MAENESIIDKVINLSSRRGLIFPSSEIYGGYGGFYDYGPYGTQLKRQIEQKWWKTFVERREDIVGMDGTIISHPNVWKASGHLEAFNDPLVTCSRCKASFRADHLVEKELKIEVEGLSAEQLHELVAKNRIKCEKCGSNELKGGKPFNLMFRTGVGVTSDSSGEAYLRPETAQMVFADFTKIQIVSRKKLPFGIAQTGKVFRNEISPRNFLFRCREFSQMEIEYFIHPTKLRDCPLLHPLESLAIRFITARMQEGGKVSEMKEEKLGKALKEGIIGTEWHAYWIAQCWRFLEGIGLDQKKLRLRQHVRTELSHYSKETWDIEFNYPEWGWKELVGIADRGDFDLTQHSKVSGKELKYFDQESSERIFPRVIESSFGLDRLLFTMLVDAYAEKKSEMEEVRTILKLSPAIAPVKIAVLPLMKKDGLSEKARKVYEMLSCSFLCEYDEAGSIGKRYARMDEVGTPLCITIDYDSLSNNDCTVRERDSGKQKRVSITSLSNSINKMLEVES